MTIRDPETNFEQLWKTFHRRYPFFTLRNVDWMRQYETYRPKVTRKTSDDELFDIVSQMLAPLNDGHVELIAKAGRTHGKCYFNPERKPRFWQEFTKREIKQLFKTTDKTLSPTVRPAHTDPGLDASLLQVSHIRLHSHPRAGRRQEAEIDYRSRHNRS